MIDMAYSEKDWEVVKACYEDGMAFAEIIARKDVVIKSKGSITKKAKAESWIHGKRKQLQDRQVVVEQEVAEIKKQKETFSPVQLMIHNEIVSKRIKMLELCDSAQELVVSISKKKLAQYGDEMTGQDINALSSAISRSRDGLVGKSPDTIINNNNTAIAQSQSVSLANIPAHELRLAYYGELDDEY